MLLICFCICDGFMSRLIFVSMNLFFFLKKNRMKLEGVYFWWEMISILMFDFDFGCLLVIDVSGLVVICAG